MKISNITIIKPNIRDWSVENHPKKQTIDLLNSFIDTVELERVVKFYREYIGISKSGDSNLFSKKISKVSSEYSSVIPEMDYLVSVLKLPTSSDSNFKYYLLFRYNTFIDLTDWELDPIKLGVDLNYFNTDLSMNLSIPFKNISFIISEKVTRNKLKEWINDNWVRIEEHMKLLPQKKVERLMNVGLTHEMYKLYEQGKTPREICVELTEKYDDKYPHLADEGWVSNKIHRYNMKLKEQSRRINIDSDFEEQFKEFIFHITNPET